MSLEGVTENEKKQIQEWLFLKQECEDCLSSTDLAQPLQNNVLDPIKEESFMSKDLDDTEMSDQETQQGSDDNDSDAEIPDLPDIDEKIDVLMKNLEFKTDNLALDKSTDFLSQPSIEDDNGNVEKALVKMSGKFS